MSRPTHPGLPPLAAEWLEADGDGGYASGTVAGYRTRRYHALLLVATTPPTGFKLVNELKRHLPGRTAQVAQLVFSDGLAAMSVFIEPLGNKSGA